MDKPIEQLRVLVCGYSEAHYPRDETILAALRNLPLKRLYDLRVADNYWVKRHSGQTTAQSRKDEVTQRFSWKRLVTWKRVAIRSLILNRQVDVILVMKWNEAFLPEIWEWAERSHIPVIYDLWVSRYILAQRDQKGEAYWRKTEAKMIKKCDRLLALTPPYKDFYVETYGCPAEKIAVLPLAVADAWLKQPASAKPSSDTFSIAYWGNVHKHHGVEVALEAARQLQAYPQIQFQFYGSFKMQALLQQLELSHKSLSNVKFPGWVKGETELIQTVDQVNLCFGHLLPSHDGHLVLPNKAMEGMARGKVVLHVDSDSMRSLYAESEVSAVHFFSGGAEGLAKAILQLAQSDSLQQAIAAQARQRIWADHSIAAISTKLEKLLTTLIPS